MNKLSGVYVLSGSGKHVWVGQSEDVNARFANGHKSAILLGCGHYVVEETPDAHKEDRVLAEWDTAQALAAGGCVVVSHHQTKRPLSYIETVASQTKIVRKSRKMWPILGSAEDIARIARALR